MVDQRYPAHLDFLTQLLDVHWPSNGNGLVLVSPDIGGVGTAPAVQITGLPIPEFNSLLGNIKLGDDQADAVEIMTQPSKAMLQHLYAWSPGYIQDNSNDGNLPLGIFPAYNFLGNILLNIGKIKDDFPSWGNSFRVNLPQLAGTGPTTGARTRYIVYLGPPNSSQAPGTYWFAVFSTGPDDYPPQTNEFILGNYDGGTPTLYLADGTPLPSPANYLTAGQIVFAYGDGSDALACATYITNNCHEVGGSTPTVSVDSWVIDIPTSGQEADEELDVGLFSTKTPDIMGNKTQNFNVNFLAGGDEGGWWTNNSPWLIKNSHQQFKTYNFGDLPAITKTVTVQYDSNGNPTGLTMT